MDSTLRPAALPPTLKELQATEEAMATLKQELATAVAVRDKLAIEVRQKDADLERCAPTVHTGLWHKAPPPPAVGCHYDNSGAAVIISSVSVSLQLFGDVVTEELAK